PTHPFGARQTRRTLLVGCAGVVVRLWCGGDDGSGYDIVGMVVMRCDEDGGGGMMKVAAGCGGYGVEVATVVAAG
ncbi:hypothetical protein Tco_1250724, partial [Tanacetum coccineum]